MLIQLTISNFKSVRDEQTIDFYAPCKRDEFPENTVVLDNSGLRVLRSIGLYGANAAGKSTVFDALYAIIDIITWHNCKPDGDIPFHNPYRLSSETRTKPTTLALEFALPIEGMAPYRRFLYSVSYDRVTITGENLIAFDDKGKEILLYSRKKGDTAQTVKFGRRLVGGRKKIPFFANQAYLAAAWKSPDSPKMLRTIAGYLCGGVDLPVAKKYGKVGQDVVATAVLPYADVGISKAIAKKKPLDPERIASMQKYLSREEFEAALSAMKDSSSTVYAFEHKGEKNESGIINLNEESEGTQKFFSFLPRLLDDLDKGLTLLEDEIDAHMHPYLAELVIRMFNDPEVNTNNAQLLFSTHNMGLLSERFMRKDQIWFAEKHAGVSEFFSLQDFDDKKVTPTSPFAQWYMDGRFGGVPNLDYHGFVQALKALQRKEKKDA